MIRAIFLGDRSAASDPDSLLQHSLERARCQDPFGLDHGAKTTAGTWRGNPAMAGIEKVVSPDGIEPSTY
jgi:hypothetical protein